MSWTEKLNAIFEKRVGIDFDGHPDLKEKLLFGKEIHMPARELVYAYTDIEDEFSVIIPQSFILDGRFDTYQHIADCIEELLQQRDCK